MKLYIKYMVSRRCKMTVEAELNKLKLSHGIVDLGEVEIKVPITTDQHDQLKIALLTSGLELMDDKKAKLIEKVKIAIIDMVHYMDEVPKKKNSVYISEKLDYDYVYLANMFSEVTGTTIEHYIIANKIERVKELLLYDELTLSEIAYRLNYSSIAHLSTQFKKITGLTPRFFKQLQDKKRLTLESL